MFGFIPVTRYPSLVPPPWLEEFAKERQARIKDKEISDQRFSALEKNRVDDGAYDGGQASGNAPLNDAQLLAAAGDPNFNITPEQQERLNKYLGLNAQ